jgi:rRNA maturation protein Nop10
MRKEDFCPACGGVKVEKIAPFDTAEPFDKLRIQPYQRVQPLARSPFDTRSALLRMLAH